MGRFYDEVARVADEYLFAARGASPKDKDKRPVLLSDSPDRRIREGLPADPPVGVGLMGSHGEDRVEEEHPLLGPLGQIAVVGYPEAEVVVKLLVDIDEGRRDRNVLVYRKTQAVRLSVPVIGILAEDDDLDLVERGQLKSRVDIPARRKDQTRLVLVQDRLIEFSVIGL